MGADSKNCRVLVNRVCIGAVTVEGYYRMALVVALYTVN